MKLKLAIQIGTFGIRHSTTLESADVLNWYSQWGAVNPRSLCIPWGSHHISIRTENFAQQTWVLSLDPPWWKERTDPQRLFTDHRNSLTCACILTHTINKHLLKTHWNSCRCPIYNSLESELRCLRKCLLVLCATKVKCSYFMFGARDPVPSLQYTSSQWHQ